MTVTVESLGHSRAHATPAGVVTFLDRTLVLDKEALNHGRARFIIASLPLGRDRIQVEYSGDRGFLTSVSSPLTITIRAPRTKPKIAMVEDGSVS
jgi:hypothetical protein